MSIEIALIRLLAVAELVEERLQRLGVAARRAPHDPAAGVVGDVGEVARPAPVGQLVAADLNQSGQTPLVEVVATTRSTSRPTVSHATRSRLCTWLLAIC